MYRVQFEAFNEGAWRSNWHRENIVVKGGAEQAIKVATERAKKYFGKFRVRVEEVTLLGTET